MGFQAFSAENVLCTLEPLTLLSFRHWVIKKGAGNPLNFSVENRGFFPAPEVIIYESFLITNADKALCCSTLAKPASERPLSHRYKLSICYWRSTLGLTNSIRA
jgi:hypothetical protein